MIKKTIPDYLESTYNLIKNSFGESIDEYTYQGLIVFLYGSMSDRNLSYILSIFIDKDEIEINNDIPKYYKLDSKNFKAIKQKLISNGYLEWLDEE